MRKRVVLLLIPMFLALTYISYKVAYGFFMDSATSLSNTFTAAATFPSPSISPSVSPSVSPGVSPSPSASPTQTVVINEIMWAGSSISSADEWMELKNMTSNPIDLTGWKIEGISGGTFNLSGIIPADGFFLIADRQETSSVLNVAPDMHSSSFGLNNTNVQYTLKDNSDVVIDIADDASGAPLAGSSSPDKAMERNSTPGDGAIGTSWHTSTGNTNLDPGASESATPKAPNS